MCGGGSRVVFLPGLYRATLYAPDGSNVPPFSAAIMSWFVYMLKCSDGTLYTGVTTDVVRRVAEHNGEGAKGKGAKYTKARRPVQLVYQEAAVDRSAAQIREAGLRKLSRIEKEQLVRSVKL